MAVVAMRTISLTALQLVLRLTIGDEGNGCLANCSEKLSNYSERGETGVLTPTF
jgi:hypothetical protein